MVGKNFEIWLGQVEKLPHPQNAVHLNEWARKYNDGREEVKKFISFLNSSFETIKQHNVERYQVSNFEGNLLVCPVDSAKTFMLALDINSQQGPAELKNFSAKDLTITHSGGDFILRNLNVHRLYIYGSKNFSFENCKIGTLHLLSKSAHDFYIHGGRIENVVCPSPAEDNPFSGSVYIDRAVYFPKKTTRLMHGPQAYRNLRSHMTKLENGPMVSHFHRLEQSVERENDTIFDRALSISYGLLSDYGSSSLRPFVWFFSIVFLTFFLTYLTDGAVVDDAQQIGWQAELKGPDRVQCAGRALVLSLQATLNPLGIFGVKGPVIAKCGLLAAWLMVHGLATTLFAALFAFAVRRRFKVS